MGSNLQPVGALVSYVNPLPPSSAGETDLGNPNRLWAAILNPTPGRTLYEVYSTIGQALETRTNRMAHRLGLGPNATAQKIAAFFGTGEERQLRLSTLRNDRETSAKLEKACTKLMGYTLPTESAKTQLQAFEKIVTLVTLFPGDDISALWDHPDGSLDPEWSFWRTFAAICLSETSISVMLEEASVSRLATCLQDNNGLSVVERLLIAHTCETGDDSTFFNALCIRYLAGILQLAEAGFWLKIGNVHGDIARKLCLKTLQVLEDISLDILPSEPSPTLESPFDYEGVDLLAETVLVGISSWFRTIDTTDWALQPWYGVFRKVVHLLRRPLSAALLPSSFSRATSDSLEKDIPTTYREVEFDILVKTSTNATTASHVAGLHYAEDPDASGEEPKPHDSAPPETKAASYIPHRRIINWGVSVRSTQSMRQFNVVVLGDRDVGKSALVVRFVRDVYVENYDPSIEEQYHRPMMVDDEQSSLEVLDTTGAEQFTSLNEIYIKSSRGFVLVFSLAQRSSLEQVKKLRKQIYRVKASETVPIVVAATESDHGSEREVPASTLESLANEWKIPFYETSAKRNLNVNDVFEDLLRQMRVRYPTDARRKQKQPQGPCTIM